MADEKNEVLPAAGIQHLEKFPVAIAAISTTLYVLGFIAVTSYLASKGIYDQPLLSTKYVLAGALVGVVSLTFYFFVWRKIEDRIRDGVTWPTPLGEPLRAFLDMYYAVESVFACCFTATMLLTLLGHSEYILLQPILWAAFGMDVLMIRLGLYKRFRKTCYFISFALNAGAIGVCVVYGFAHPPLFSLMLIFISLSVLASVVLSSAGWKSGQDRAYGVFYIALYALLAVVGFGATVYEHISPKYGGATPALVSIHLSSDVDESIRKVFNENVGAVYLVLETEGRSTFRLGHLPAEAKYFQLDRKFIEGLLFHQPASLTSVNLSNPNAEQGGLTDILIRAFSSIPK